MDPNVRIWYGLYYIDSKGFLEKAKRDDGYSGEHIKADTKEELIAKMIRLELGWTDYVILEHVYWSAF